MRSEKAKSKSKKGGRPYAQRNTTQKEIAALMREGKPEEALRLARGMKATSQLPPPGSPQAATERNADALVRGCQITEALANKCPIAEAFAAKQKFAEPDPQVWFPIIRQAICAKDTRFFERIIEQLTEVGGGVFPEGRKELYVHAIAGRDLHVKSGKQFRKADAKQIAYGMEPKSADELNVKAIEIRRLHKEWKANK